MITKALLILTMALVGWGGLLLGLARFTDAAPALLVAGADAQFLGNLPDHVRLVDQRAAGVIVQSDAAGLARLLYAHGAYAVLPAGLPACVPVPRGA